MDTIKAFTQYMTIAPNVPSVQRGPQYQCPHCGDPIHVELLPWMCPTNTELDQWTSYLHWIPMSACHCGDKRRWVVKWGSYITPAPINQAPARDFDEKIKNNIAAIREALARIAREAPLAAGRAPDPAAGLVWKLMAGRLSPDAAILAFHDLLEGR